MPETPKAQIAQAVVSAVAEVASNPKNSLQVQDAAVVAREVTEKIAPSVIHATNNEPWYQSRVTWGALIAAVGAAYTLAIDFTDGTAPTVEIFTAQIGVIVGAVTTIYGRYAARVPLGS